MGTDGWMTDNAVSDQTAKAEKPALTILGVFRGGKLVRAEWSQEQIQLTDKTILACEALGMIINDDPANYLWKTQVF